MDAKERAELLRVIRLICGISKGDDTDVLAERIIQEIETTGWNITRPISIKPSPTELN